MTHRALVVRADPSGTRERPHAAALEDVADEAAGDADLVVDVEFSSVNYKDALALAGRPGIISSPPLAAGIDAVGTVAAAAGRFSVGDAVVVNGAGIGERTPGGLSERVRVDPASVVGLPEGITPWRAAAIGTAGFTAMLSVLALERHGVAPDSGPVLVTGAAGGVGTIAVALLARLGYDVTASTGRVDEQGGRLRALGARTVVDRADLGGEGKPLQKAAWAGAIDSVGSRTLANVLARTAWGGTVTACGLAQGADLPTTVLPFILRGVTLAGINSVDAPLVLREEAWARLAADLDPAVLDDSTATIPLAGALSAAEEVLAGRVAGRIVVDVRA
ncbi:MDR family oxidoreductase [Microbacterium sp. NPDC055683]